MCRRRAIQGLVALVVPSNARRSPPSKLPSSALAGGLNPPWTTPKASPNRLFAATTNYKA